LGIIAETGLEQLDLRYTPAGVFSTGNGYGWYTNIEDQVNAENSYVESPCFDFTQSKRPMVKVNLWREFTGTTETPLDGAVLQYTTNNGATCRLLVFSAMALAGIIHTVLPGNRGTKYRLGGGSGWGMDRSTPKLDELKGLTMYASGLLTGPTKL
jgi:hypothetical protein